MKELKREYKKLKREYKTKKFKVFVLDILTTNSSPRQIAMGSSIGIFLSVFPTFAIGMFLALFIAWKKKYNLAATFLGTALVVNPFSASFFYLMEYKLGSLLIGETATFSFPFTFGKFTLIAEQLYLGGIIMATFISIISYFIIFYLVEKHREKHKICKLDAK